ncbi:hypothetical protein [Paenibacillus albus]|uniref:Uncharacterized protein n=1 Tax=Paenibacillus albus TaxID=2495582 RepID=A0A3Q8X9E5_9BACL|nr:hypothetical protein [Paenibacillus albus]AZN43004.1 hypothetical protein EJC50_27385 [Paenibacillus albus]
MRWNGDSVARVWRREEGSVSLYLIVSTAAMLLLTSLLIDFARIAAFERQTELAAQSGIRSALSAYDDGLYERYALFGTGGSDRGELFEHAAQHNWTGETAGSFRLLNMKTEASHVDSYEVLGSHEVFKRQVLEEMKYKAPIDFTLEIASKFVPIAEAMKEASNSVDLLGQVQQLYEEREKKLDEVLALQKQAAAAASERLPALLSSTGPSIINGYGNYVRWKSEDASLEDGEEPAHQAQIAAYVSRAASGAASIAASGSQALNLHQEYEQQAQAALLEAKQYNASIQVFADSLSASQAGGGYDRISQKEIAGSEPASMTPAKLNELQQSGGAIAALVLESDWFEIYAEELQKQTAAIQRVSNQSAQFKASVSSALSRQGSSSSMSLALQDLKSSYNEYEMLYGVTGSIIQSRDAERTKRQASDKERKANEAAASSKLSEVKQLVEQLKAAPDQEENRKAFQQVEQRKEANLKFNQAVQHEVSSSEPLGEDSGETVQQSMSEVGSIYSGMADLLDDVRDPLYINEYVAHRFKAFDPKQFILSNGQQGTFSQELALENQEVEYILYGFHEPAANVAAAYGELFALRLALRTMEGFIECRALGHPLLVFSAAVLYGIEKAIADMAVLSEKGSIPLSKYAPAELSYLDYLRLFLVLHGVNEARIARMIAVIEQNTGTDLSKVSTGLTGELTASVNLWFLPGLMRSFTAGGILSGKVKGNRYETTRTIGWFYG